MRHAPAIGDYITREEVAALSAKSDARAAATVLFQAGLAVAAFALAIAWPNPLTILAAIIILGGRIQARARAIGDQAIPGRGFGQGNGVVGGGFAVAPAVQNAQDNGPGGFRRFGHGALLKWCRYSGS